MALNPAFLTVLTADAETRRGLFETTARRLGTSERYVEKDFWVCLTLDVLFNGRSSGGPRLLFKGGTSLSKAYGLIDRFSEDIDVTVFRDDLGEPGTVEALAALSRKKRDARLDAIRDACSAYINGALKNELHVAFDKLTIETGHPPVDSRRTPSTPVVRGCSCDMPASPEKPTATCSQSSAWNPAPNRRSTPTLNKWSGRMSRWTSQIPISRYRAWLQSIRGELFGIRS